MINYSYNYNYNYPNIHIRISVIIQLYLFVYQRYTYKYMSTYKYFSMCIRIHVSIPFQIVDCYKNTIGDMQREMDFYSHCNEFEYNLK